MIRFLQTPGPIKKVVLGGILLIICAAMLVYLIPSSGSTGFGGPPAGVVAKVGDQDVTRPEVLRQAQMMLRQQSPRGNAMASQLLPFFTSRAAEQLITQKALVVEAERMGLRASDEELRDELQHGIYATTLFPGGKFIGEDAYQNLLQNAELTVPQFEAGVKQDVLVRKLRNLVAASASVNDTDVRKEFDKRNTKIKFQYAVITEADLRKGIHPTETELKAFYERNKATYNNSIPEKRKLTYAVIDNSRIASLTQVTPDDLQSYYNQHRDEYRVPEQVNVRHILISAPEGSDGKVDPKVLEDARTKAQDVLKQLKAGAKFEDLAKKYSGDKGSAEKGGSLGWINCGVTVEPFDKEAFSLPKGGTSDLVQSIFGFHIIHVDDKQDAHMKALDEVKPQIEPIVKQQKVAKLVEDQGQALLKDAVANGLDKAAAAKGLQVVTTDFFGRMDSLPGIGSSPQFTEAVFGAAEKSQPDLVQVSQGTVVYLLTEIKPA